MLRGISILGAAAAGALLTYMWDHSRGRPGGVRERLRRRLSGAPRGDAASAPVVDRPQPQEPSRPAPGSQD